ncbi:MAG: hypothetical protein RLZ60_1254, partial [Pseudomonadota bacterium]
IGDAQRRPVLAFKGEVASREMIEQPALRLVK